MSNEMAESLRRQMNCISFDAVSPQQNHKQ